MDPVPNHEFMELHTIHQHQPHCKRQCYVFSDIADIELPQVDLNLTQYTCNMTTNDKLKKCNQETNFNKNTSIYLNEKQQQQNLLNQNKDNNKKFHNEKILSSSSSSSNLQQDNTTNGSGKFIFIFGTIFVCIALAGGIPLALQLRSSSLLEARLNFIKRLLNETPLIGYFNTDKLNKNISNSILEIKTNLISAILWPINVPCKSQYLDSVQLTLEGIDKAQRLIGKTKELKLIENTDDIININKNKQIAVILGLNGGHTIGASLAVLRSIYSLGNRFISITSTECTTPWAQAAYKNQYNDNYNYNSNNNDNDNQNNNNNLQVNSSHALSNFGQTVVHEMNRLGMLVEISRLSEPAMMITIKTTKAPVLITNAVPLSLCNSSVLATIPDRILSLLPDNGGVFMINTEKCNDRKLSIKEAIQIINYVRRITGINHIGLSGVPHSYPFLLAELARDRIWGNSAIKKLVGGNILRVLKEIEIIKNRLPINEEWIPYEQTQLYSRCKYPET